MIIYKVIFLLLVSLSLFAEDSSIESAMKYYTQETLYQHKQLIEKLKKEALEGSIDAAFLLASAYKNNLLETSKKDNALRWYLVAAEHNDYESMLMIGWIYYEGNSYQSKNEQKALYWFKEAANHGVVEAIEMLHLLE